MNAKDPVAVFPPEILALIFSQLPFRTKINCTLVNKAWKAYFVSEPKLWTEIHLSDSTSFKVRPAHVDLITKRSHRYLQKLCLSAVTATDRVLKVLFSSHCNLITQLSITGVGKPIDTDLIKLCRKLGKVLKHLNLRDTEIKDTVITAIFNNCVSLASLDVSHCIRITSNGFKTSYESLKKLKKKHPLKKLVISHCPLLDDSAISNLPSMCPSLQFIDLTNSSRITNWSIYNLQYCKQLSTAFFTGINYRKPVELSLDDTLTTFFLSCSNLRLFHLTECPILTDLSVQSLVISCERLETLYLTNDVWITDESLVVLSELRSLKRVDLGGCKKITDVGLDSLVDNCREIQYLNVSKTAITNTALEWIGNKLDRLNALNVSYCALISDLGLKHVLKNGIRKKLKVVDVSGCVKISSAFLESARRVAGKRVMIRYQVNDQNKRPAFLNQY